MLRGDIEKIIVGEGSNIQDGSVLHTDPGGVFINNWQGRYHRSYGNVAWLYNKR